MKEQVSLPKLHSKLKETEYLTSPRPKWNTEGGFPLQKNRIVSLQKIWKRAAKVGISRKKKESKIIQS